MKSTYIEFHISFGFALGGYEFLLTPNRIESELEDFYEVFNSNGEQIVRAGGVSFHLLKYYKDENDYLVSDLSEPPTLEVATSIKSVRDRVKCIERFLKGPYKGHDAIINSLVKDHGILRADYLLKSIFRQLSTTYR